MPSPCVLLQRCSFPWSLSHTSVQVERFRGRISGEVVAVLQALRLKYNIMFCDRPHWMTVDRLVSHYSVQQLEDGVNEVVESLTATAEEDSSPVVMENLLLPPFPELFQERQRVMTHCALQASSRAPVMVCGWAVEPRVLSDTAWLPVCSKLLCSSLRMSRF